MSLRVTCRFPSGLGPSASIGDVRKVDTVFRKGIGFDPIKLIDSVKGKVGLW